MITEQQLRAAVADLPKSGDVFLPHLQRFLPAYGFTSMLQVAHFLAQVGHESGGFRHVREIWGNTPAQRRYDTRTDLGNTRAVDGDGKLYMGRGLIQITGKANYQEVSQHIFKDSRLLINPQLLEVPEYAVQSACYFWQKRNLNAIASRGATDAVVLALTKRINGGTNGLQDRINRFKTAHAALRK